MQTRAGSGGTATLAERLAARRMPLGAAMAMLDALTEIVGECHRQGRADGALTPARALLDGASVRLDPAVGAADPAYLSPQQLEGKAADSRADVFALGVIAYRAITGADPFGGPAAGAAARLAAIEKGAADPGRYVPKLAEHVRRTLLVALARNLTERFADALTMRAALRGESQVALDSPTLKWAVPGGCPKERSPKAWRSSLPTARKPPRAAPSASPDGWTPQPTARILARPIEYRTSGTPSPRGSAWSPPCGAFLGSCLVDESRSRRSGRLGCPRPAGRLKKRRRIFLFARTGTEARPQKVGTDMEVNGP